MNRKRVVYLSVVSVILLIAFLIFDSRNPNYSFYIRALANTKTADIFSNKLVLARTESRVDTSLVRTILEQLSVDDLMHEPTPLDRDIVYFNFDQYEKNKGSITNISLCDLMTMSGKEYSYGSNSYSKDLRFDLDQLVSLSMDYLQKSRCEVDGNCDPFFLNLSHLNNSVEREWVLKFVKLRSPEQVFELPEDSDDVLFFKAATYAGLLSFPSENNSLNKLPPASADDLMRALDILLMLSKKYPDHLVYPYQMILVKKKLGLDFMREFDLFLNATDAVGPYEKIQKFVFAQGLQSLLDYRKSRVVLGSIPRLSYWETHEILVEMIPKLSEQRKKRFQKLATRLFHNKLNQKGLVSGLSGYFADNWLRRLHDPFINSLPYHYKAASGTITDYDFWDRFFDSVKKSKCDESELKTLLEQHASGDLPRL